MHVLGRKRGTNVFRPRSEEHPDDETFPGLLLLGLEGRIFFANAERIGQKVRRHVAEATAEGPGARPDAVFDLEYTALKMLTEGESGARGGHRALVGRLEPRCPSMLQRSPLGQTLGRDRMVFNLEMAVARYQRTESTPARPEPREPA